MNRALPSPGGVGAPKRESAPASLSAALNAAIVGNRSAGALARARARALVTVLGEAGRRAVAARCGSSP